MLTGKIALITGGGRGIGRAVALALAKEGAGVTVVARKEDQLEETASLCKKNGASFADVLPADLTSGKAIDELAEQLLKKHGTVDILVNNAGVVQGKQSPIDGSPDDWDSMLALNLAAPMRLTRRFTPAMIKKGGGTIINVCSIAGIDALPGQAAYAASKHGLRGWSISCYEALRNHNIKVMAINPAYVNTDMVDSPQVNKDMVIQPEDIAETVMLAFRTSSNCVPEEVTLRIALAPKK